MKAPARWTWHLEDSFKETDVEEWIDVRVHRPLAFLLIRPLEHYGRWISPTHISLLSLAVGIAAALAFVRAERGAFWVALGAGLLFVSVVLDCADGQLARLRGEGTTLGMMIDGGVDIIVGSSVWFALSLMVTSANDAWWAWPACIVVALSIVAHLSVYESFKNTYLWNVRGEVMPPTSEDASRYERLIAFIYDKVYGFANTGPGTPRCPEPVAYERAMRPHMRSITFLGLGTHMFLVVGTVLATVGHPDALLAAMVATIAGAMNLWAVWRVVRWKRAEARLPSSLA